MLISLNQKCQSKWLTPLKLCFNSSSCKLSCYLDGLTDRLCLAIQRPVHLQVICQSLHQSIYYSHFLFSVQSYFQATSPYTISFPIHLLVQSPLQPPVYLPFIYQSIYQFRNQSIYHFSNHQIWCWHLHQQIGLATKWYQQRYP